MVALRRTGSASGPFRFRISDSVSVPLRGRLLRLRLLEGEPALGDVAIGRKLRLTGPAGLERVVTIRDYAATGGRQTQARLDRTRELDVIISNEDAGPADALVDIGWVAMGPVSEDGRGGAR